MTGIKLIAAERATHARKGFNKAHDSRHWRGQIATAAACLLLDKRHRWGLTAKTKKEGGRIRQLVVAGALIAAEIDRLNNQKGKP